MSECALNAIKRCTKAVFQNYCLSYNDTMEIEFSVHALEQLEIRSRITKHMVLETLRKSDGVSQSFREREIYRKKFGAEYLEVVAKKEDNKIVVITQYFLEQ